MNTKRQHNRRQRHRGKEQTRKALEYLNLDYHAIKWFFAVFPLYQRKREIEETGNISAAPTRRFELKGNSLISEKHYLPRIFDFIADVEIAGRSVCSWEQLGLLDAMAVMVPLPEDGKYAVVAERLGKELKRRGIYPLEQYFQEPTRRRNER